MKAYNELRELVGPKFALGVIGLGDFLKIAVIGSGASAVAALSYMKTVDCEVSIFDSGAQDSNLVRVMNKFAFEPKRFFGSAETYFQRLDEKIEFTVPSLAMPTRALGGLTRTWGATFDWSAYENWLEKWGLERVDIDILGELVPTTKSSLLIANRPNKDLQRSEKIRKALEESTSSTHLLKDPILAVNSAHDSIGSSYCTGLGKCLRGCPRDSIWFAGDALSKLLWKHKSQFLLRSNHLVTKISSTGSSVRVAGLSHAGKFEETYDKVFIACGTLASGVLVTNSELLEKVSVRETYTVFGGILSSVLNPGSSGNALSRYWLEPKTPKDDLYFQIYRPNDSLLEKLRTKLRIQEGLSKPLDLVVNRILPFVAYLNSNLSSQTEIRSERGVSFINNPQISENVSHALAQLKSMKRSLLPAGFILPTSQVEFAPALSGYHLGAGLSHGVETNELGELPGAPNVHIVDSSVLPDVFQGSITPATMLNAIRIARQALQ